MYSRRFYRLATAGATLATSLALTVLAAPAAPAAAAVRYDPEAKTGFVDRDDVRNAFGWSDAVLASRAAGIVFDHDFWTDDTYSVSCGLGAFPVVHHRDFGRFELADVLARTVRGATTGYGPGLSGFRLTGARSGISGTSVPPAVGQPCPEERGPVIDEVHLVSTTTGWALAARSGDDRRELVAGRHSSGLPVGAVR